MKPSCDKAAVTKQSNSCDDPLASTADVESFVNKIIQKASHAVLVEVTHWHFVDEISSGSLFILLFLNIICISIQISSIKMS